MNELVDASPGHDGSQLAVRQSALTNNSTVLDGMTVLWEREIPPEGRWSLNESDAGSTSTGPKRLLVFVTPRLIKADGTLVHPEATTANESANLVARQSAPEGNP